jgi:succinate dehydrogenase / fumarate reductase iron-sulfur subunit
MQDIQVPKAAVTGIMLLDVLKAAKEIDASLTFRHSCGAGVCGSDGMNINGKNGLACVTQLDTLPNKIVLRPLPGMPVIKDLVVDLALFYQQYNSIKPYLQAKPSKVDEEFIQSETDRKKIDGLYECILCACCTTSCPSWWWNPDKFVGPAGLSFYHGLTGPEKIRAIERSRRAVPFVPLSWHYELRCGLSKGLESNKGYRYHS